MRKRWMVALLIVVLAAGMPVLRAQEPEGADEDNPPDGGAAAPKWAKVSEEQIEAAGELKLPVAKELDLGGGVTMKLVLIPKGEFMMGSPAGESGRDDDEGPQHRVRITKPFYMGVTQVTQGQWRAVMGTEPWSGQKCPGRSKDAAMNHVSWNAATEFCGKLSQRAGTTVRLPMEAEWEYACRAGSTTRFCFGDSDDELGAYAWYEDNAWDVGEKYPHSVAKKKPNAWGLYDMHGNVWEWCRDWYDEDYYGKSPGVDPEGPRSGSARVLRGGSWDYAPCGCRSAGRGGLNPSNANGGLLGFRVVVGVE